MVRTCVVRWMIGEERFEEEDGDVIETWEDVEGFKWECLFLRVLFSAFKS